MITVPKHFKKLVAGDYICKIKSVKIAPNRNSEPCLWLSLDIEEGPYKGYFESIYQNRKNRKNDNYPCIYCQSMSSYSIRFFQSLLHTIIASNSGYQSTCESGKDWDEQELVGLLVGVTFTERKFVNARGREQINLIPMKFKDIHLIQDKQINKENNNTESNNEKDNENEKEENNNIENNNESNDAEIEKNQD